MKLKKDLRDLTVSSDENRNQFQSSVAENERLITENAGLLNQVKELQSRDESLSAENESLKHAELSTT